MPKINLITFGGRETAGLRLDDLILLIGGGCIFLGSLLQKRRLLSLEIWLLVLFIFALFSFVINHILIVYDVITYPANILYCVRILEYFVFFYIGALAMQFFELKTIICYLVIVNCTAIFLQKLGVIGEFGLNGYSPHAAYRPSGLAAFPSEMGAVLNLLFCYLLFDDPSQSLKFSQFTSFFRKQWLYIIPYLLFILFAFVTILTGSRIALIALVIPFAFKIGKQISWRSPVTLVITGFCLVLLAILFYITIGQTYSIASRGMGLFSFRNLELIADVWEHIDITYDPVGNEVVEFKDFDQSWWMRAHKWGYVLKIYYLNPECWLQGVGPGFAFSGLDGGWLRIFVEYGLIGCFLFWKVFASIYRVQVQLKWMMIAFSINMITFDAYLAYKPMSLLFFVAGYMMCSKESENIATHKPKIEIALA